MIDIGDYVYARQQCDNCDTMECAMCDYNDIINQFDDNGTDGELDFSEPEY